MISIVDYGMGNLRSLRGALEWLALPCRVVQTAAEVDASERLILPGVGSFAAAMRNLGRLGLRAALDRAVRERRVPTLGICLGMQLLAESGDEDGPTPGLGWIPGAVRRLPSTDPRIRIPHIGFNTASFAPGSRLLGGAERDRADLYFVHSYRLVETDEALVSAWAEHGVRFPAAVERGNLFGTQFHPEKSQGDGLRILMRFSRLRGAPC